MSSVRRFSAVLGRALGEVFKIRGALVEDILPNFFERAAWELYHECQGEFGSLAILISKASDGPKLVCRAKDVPTLPSETLLGMAAEEWGSNVGCRVRDHALDTVRFIDARFRSSMLLRLPLPKTLNTLKEGMVWIGLHGPASAKRIELAQTIVLALSEWLSIYAPVLKGSLDLNTAITSLRGVIGEARSLAHDVKAPVAALKYLMSHPLDASREPQRGEHFSLVRDELNYVERLLERFAPSADRGDKVAISDQGSDLILVAKRVCDRFYAQALKRGVLCRITTREERNYHGAKISELDLERVLSNLVGNCVLHSEASEVRIDIERTKIGSWILRVSDNGVGIPSAVVERVMLGGIPSRSYDLNLAAESGRDRSGWGIGLGGCRGLLRRYGGDLVILSPKVGSLIEVTLPGCVVALKPLQESCNLNTIARTEVNGKPSDNPDKSSDSGARRLIIVDDDCEHSQSLAKILAKRGVKSDVYGSVDSAFKACVSGSAGEVSGAVVCDAQMPDGGAERMLKLLGTSGVRVRFAVMSGESSETSIYRFAALGAREFFAKPLDIDRVIAWL